ncbi:hypothetical protein [Croceibacterium aestuarii]|uniref:hypothetical protein n=1 Tax=Croceibacterium aestuarii TaxID=3064139 RepID=UPI00272ED734|nr:hypothetical protein [Croceibacterium sp. D39]
MDRPFNFWDLLIGVGYGTYISMLVYRLMGWIPVRAMLVCNIIWLATICLQIARTLKQRQEAGPLR